MVPSAPRHRPSLPWVQAVLVGLPGVVLGLVLLTGSIATAAQILVFSVICTLGIGALFWLGLALVLGLALLYGADQLSRLRGRSGGLGLFPSPREPAVGGAASAGGPPALSDYAARRLAEGGDPQRIRRDLLQAGWAAPQVDHALGGGREP